MAADFAIAIAWTKSVCLDNFQTMLNDAFVTYDSPAEFATCHPTLFEESDVVLGPV